MVGFTAAIHINGSSTTVKPILQDMLLCCSGDDGIDVHGKAQPLIRSCEIRVRMLELVLDFVCLWCSNAPADTVL